ncbi:MAG: hypothetical protein QGF59_29900 [Pirellulaceae bacterium]|jgi:hypothetical protein|nr:hypothetical protein [Pirellulaceae bacterium]
MLRTGQCLPWFVICASCLTSIARAQAIALHHSSETGQKQEVRQLWKLMLTPMPEGRPALKRSLLPRYWEQQHGDATPFYLRALMQEAGLPAETRNVYRDHVDEWMWTADELGQDARKAIREWLAAYDKILEDVRVATYRERIDLDLRLRDLSGLDAIYFRLPAAQRTRDLARMLQIKVRLEISEGQYDEAIETLRMGYRLAEFAAETPTLINDLVGVAIANIMTHELVRLIGSPDAPNMYWAIASLPRPLIDMRQAFEHESAIVLQIFPFLKDAETARRSPDQWRQLVVGVFTLIPELTGDSADKKEPLSPAQVEELMMKGFPQAKQELVNDGVDKKTVDAMSAGQVIAIHAARRNRRMYDENYKWFMLSFAEAREHWALSQPNQLPDDATPTNTDGVEIIPITSILMPSFRPAWHASMRLERQLAAVRAIEAIRMHAAANEGTLPKSLANITAAVVPDDPFLDQPFTYRVTGETAILTTKSAGTDEPWYEIYRYELTIKK